MDAPPPYPGQTPEKQGYPPPQQGYGAPQQGYPPPQQGYPPPQQGYPPPQQGYPPPQQGYPPPGGQPLQPGYPPTSSHTTVITTQPAMVTAIPCVFHEFPVSMTCPSCRAQIVTAVVYEPGTFAWLLFILMCVFGFWICCFIPFCMDSCKDAIHTCPNCRGQVGVYRRM